jgi:hypothetical protein
MNDGDTWAGSHTELRIDHHPVALDRLCQRNSWPADVGEAQCYDGNTVEADWLQRHSSAKEVLTSGENRSLLMISGWM